MENTVFICPICSSPLKVKGKSLFCGGEKQHCYDISSEGYVNLLPPGRKNNKTTGDDSHMLSSRRRFLSLGFYDEISRHAALIALKNKKDIALFADAGCGEGHHTLNILKTLSKNQSECSVTAVGLDASKHGAAQGAKSAKRQGFSGLALSGTCSAQSENKSRAFFAAANIFSCPVCDKSADAVFSLFAPVPDGEAHRILKDDGILVVCSSGSRHLWQMREALYGEPRLSPPLDRVPDGFQLTDSASLTYEITLEGEQIADLFTMTPFYYRSPREGREKLLSIQTLTTEISVEYKVYRKI